MKWLLIVCMALLSFSFGFVATSNAEVNLLQNPGFEELGWPPAYWDYWWGSERGKPGDGVTLWISTTVAHTGSQSTVAELTGRHIRWGGYSQDIDIIEGTTVTASGWLMSDENDNPLRRAAEAYIELKFLDESDDELAVYTSDSLTGASTWVQHSITEQAPAGTAKARFSFALFGGGAASAGKVYFDDGVLGDITAPVVTITSPDDLSTAETSPVPVAGTVDDPTITTIDVNGNIEPVSSGSWSSDVSIIEGSNRITATATDASDNEGADGIIVYYEAPYINILDNPGFEEVGWPPLYWSSWDGGGGAVGYISDTVWHTGLQSAVRELYGSGDRWGGYSQDVSVNIGEPVTASGWLMSDDSDNPLANGAEAYIELTFLDGGDNVLAAYQSTPITGASLWVQHSITQQAPAGTAEARFSFVLTGSEISTGKVYFDDAAIGVDRTPPVVTIISPPDGIVVSAGIIPVVGTVNELSIGEVDLDGNIVSCYEGKWESNLSVVEGENTITVTATDALGNIGSDTAIITYDPDASTDLFEIIYPADGAVFYETPALVTATLLNPEDLYININGREYLAVDGALIAHVPITGGANTLELRCHDQTDYEEVKYLNVTYNTAGTDFGGIIANSGFDNSRYPQKDWIRWSGSESLLPTDGSASFISTIYKRSEPQSSGQILYGGTIRWGGLSQEFPVVEGDTINASAYVASFTADDPLAGGAEVYIGINYISNRGNQFEEYASSKITAATDWVQLSVSSTVPDGAETAIFTFNQFAPDGGSGTVYFDDVYVEVIDENYTPDSKSPFDKPQSTGPVQISGNTLLVNEEAFTIKGVCYQPVPIGYDVGEYDIYGDPNIYNRDLPILRDMGANTVRTYSQWLSTGFLDACYNGGVDPVYVIMGFYIDHLQDLSDPDVRDQIKTNFQNYVNTYKNYPAVLMWSPGNEVELHHAGDDRPYYSLLNELAEVAYVEEGGTYHPVTGVLWDVVYIDDNGLLTTDEDIDYLDAWGTNIYEGMSFTNMFDDFIHRSEKVFWVAEFGTDAWHVNDKYGDPSDGYLDEASQNQLDVALWDEIAARGDVCSGGTVMEYSDEWWKDHESGEPAVHNYGGYAIHYETVSHPDEYSNEEWYGVVAVSDNGNDPDIITKREAFYGLRLRWLNIVNLLQNPGFEEVGWPPNYWSSWDGGGGVVGYLTQAYYHSGIQSAAKKFYGSGIRWGGYSQEVVASEGDDVTASGWLMSNASDQPLANGAEAHIELKFVDGVGAQLALYTSTPITGASPWVQHSINQQAPANTAKAIFSFVTLGTENSTGIVYFDDAFLEIE